jgi:subtilase family serine protease
LTVKRIVLIGAVVAAMAGALTSPALAGYADSQGPVHSSAPVCAPPQAGAGRCHARVVTDAKSGKPLATVAYAGGYAPADLVAAYSIGGGGGGQTVAIVDAYDNPNAEADLAVYRSRFGLAPCTTANGCFRKVNQRGQAGPYPAGNVGWGQEIALDLDMVSAVCPACHVLLVESDSNQFSDLATAVDTAAAMGANAISNSYGANEFSSEATLQSHYNHPGVAITVSSGDNGYGVEFPAASAYVTAVGGTRLSRATTTRGWTESAWTGAGSGCSSYIAKPSWQTDTGCARRSVADVSAVADPSTGVAVYDSYGSSGGANWFVFGGTSVAAPIIAAVYAVAGNAGSLTYASFPYAHASSLWDITSGSNGRCGKGRNTAALYLCTARIGYDGPTGMGTPSGIGAF